jgi:CRISPR-associated protein Csh2
MSTSFKNRVFGCAIIKSINSNYNADFSHQPRTLPDGTVYATDKTLKYSIRNYMVKHYP